MQPTVAGPRDVGVEWSGVGLLLGPVPHSQVAGKESTQTAMRNVNVGSKSTFSNLKILIFCNNFSHKNRKRQNTNIKTLTMERLFHNDFLSAPEALDWFAKRKISYFC